jgi:hypothetical protein
MAAAPIIDRRALQETEEERQAHLRYERAVIVEARADVVAGRTIDLEALEAWFAELERNPDAPPPLPIADAARR